MGDDGTSTALKGASLAFAARDRSVSGSRSTTSSQSGPLRKGEESVARLAAIREFEAGERHQRTSSHNKSVGDSQEGEESIARLAAIREFEAGNRHQRTSCHSTSLGALEKGGESIARLAAIQEFQAGDRRHRSSSHKDSVGAPKKGEEDVARLAAIREFEAAKSHKSSVGSRYGDEDAITVSSSRSPSPHGKAGLVGDLIQQFSLNAAGKAVDEQRRRSSIIPRDAAARKTSDAQSIAAKHAAGQSEVKKREADSANSAAAASSVPNSYQTKSGVTIIYPERRERRSSSRTAQEIHNDGDNGSRLSFTEGMLSPKHPADFVTANGSLPSIRSSSQSSRRSSVNSVGRPPIPPKSPKIATFSPRLPAKPPSRQADDLLSLPGRASPLTKSPSPLTRPPLTSTPSSSTTYSSKESNLPPPRRTSLQSTFSGTSGGTATSNGPEDAKIASSLAAHRIPNAMRGHPTPPLPPRRRRKDHSDQSRSPQRPLLKQTLRSDKNKEEEAEEKRKNHYRHHIIRNPHKHHEGDRKRWRVSITARERKRYEGLWAANRGLWITVDNEGNPRTPPEGLMELLPEGAAPENMVLNLVVEELWSRSRLSQDTLEAIWDLVSHTAYGMLSREEFVVGIWLIDQCLRGRKLPVKVPRSVWASTQAMPSVELIPPKRKN